MVVSRLSQLLLTCKGNDDTLGYEIGVLNCSRLTAKKGLAFCKVTKRLNGSIHALFYSIAHRNVVRNNGGCHETLRKRVRNYGGPHETSRKCEKSL